MLGGYMSFVEPVRLQVEEATVAMPAARTGPPITVGVLSDIQSERVGAWEHAAVDRLLAASPDVILVPGDLLQGCSDTIETQWEPIRTLLARLRAPGGVYFVSGNCESRLDVATLLAGLDITLLDNRVAPTVVRGRRLTIGGVEDDWRSGAARAVIRRLEGLPGDDDVRLLMAHRPDAVLNVSPDSRIDLVVAGHTHGGQVQLPWFGPPLTLSRVPRRVAAGGLHVLDGRRIYVSRGLGRERGQAPSIRLLCPPEITLLSLQ
jgi:predicted MPP superfamily phosphohydrolase